MYIHIPGYVVIMYIGVGYMYIHIPGYVVMYVCRGGCAH